MSSPDGDVAAGTPEVLHYLHDVLGSVVALTNASGDVVERYDYDPYGKTYITDSTLTTYLGESKYGNPFMWAGQAFDQNARQYHFWAWAYSPHLGRWLQRDPLGYVDGVSLYEHTRSAPVCYFDPLGLHSIPDDVDEWIEGYEEHIENVEMYINVVADLLLTLPGIVDDLVSIAIDLGFDLGTDAVIVAGLSLTPIPGDELVALTRLLERAQALLGKAIKAGKLNHVEKLKKIIAKLRKLQKRLKKAKKGEAGKSGVGKTGRKLNQTRGHKIRGDIEEAYERLRKAKTKNDKEAIQKEIRHLRTKLRKSENHANRGQGCRQGNVSSSR